MKLAMAMMPLVLATIGAMGCASDSGGVDATSQADGTRLLARRGTLVIDGCALDAWQADALKSGDLAKVVEEVVLLCLVPRVDATIGPADPSARAALGVTVATLRKDGFTVRLALSFTDETGARFDGAQEAMLVGSETWRAGVVSNLAPLLPLADGLELDMEQIPSTARTAVTTLVSEVALATHAAGKTLGVFVPPSLTVPSDLPGGDAFDVQNLAKSADRIRVMTLDYSDQGAGPTIDPGWATTAANLAVTQAGQTHVDLAYPLYGVDFSSAGKRLTTYLEALGLAASQGAEVSRGPTYAPHFDWRDSVGQPHELWFDDAQSTLVALRAWDAQAIPASVGVVYYGFGAEDPALWSAIAKATP